MQLKFNVIIYGIIGNLTELRAGLPCAALCGLCFFWSIALFNYLSRFFLSLLLSFAGTGFIVENLWGRRTFFLLREWAQIVIILVVFIASASMLYAVLVSFFITMVVFLQTYAGLSRYRI